MPTGGHLCYWALLCACLGPLQAAPLETFPYLHTGQHPHKYNILRVERDVALPTGNVPHPESTTPDGLKSSPVMSKDTSTAHTASTAQINAIPRVLHDDEIENPALTTPPLSAVSRSVGDAWDDTTAPTQHGDRYAAAASPLGLSDLASRGEAASEDNSIKKEGLGFRQGDTLQDEGSELFGEYGGESSAPSLGDKSATLRDSGRSDANDETPTEFHHLQSLNDTQLTISLSRIGDSLLVEWDTGSNDTGISGFVVRYQIKNREDFDSSKLGNQVRSFILHSLHEDEKYVICVQAMVNSTLVKETCAVWSEPSMKMVVGIMAGTVFLVPCVIVLIWILRKDKLMRHGKGKYNKVKQVPESPDSALDADSDEKKGGQGGSKKKEGGVSEMKVKTGLWRKALRHDNGHDNLYNVNGDESDTKVSWIKVTKTGVPPETVARDENGKDTGAFQGKQMGSNKSTSTAETQTAPAMASASQLQSTPSHICSRNETVKTSAIPSHLCDGDTGKPLSASQNIPQEKVKDKSAPCVPSKENYVNGDCSNKCQNRRGDEDVADGQESTRKSNVSTITINACATNDKDAATVPANTAVGDTISLKSANAQADVQTLATSDSSDIRDNLTPSEDRTVSHL